ncbi:MAG: helix-turn-helix transcriptional regulator [Blautia sp.]|nr:helix-turn-helix transcriptional regulator [Blautia sp.]
MIKHLSGIYETPDYQSSDTQIVLYHNNEYENYPPHWHTSFELIMPLENGYRVNCGEETFTLREGDILIICPSMIHELFAPETGERIIFQPGLQKISIKEMNLLTSVLSPAFLITPEEYPQIIDRIRQLMLEIEGEYFSGASYAEASVFSKFLEMMVLIGRNHKVFTRQSLGQTDTRQREYVEKFLFITSYIDEHFAEDLTLEDVASLAGFSKYHFSRLFKMYTDNSFYKFLNQKRIDHAKILLADPNLTVLEVATQSGFASLSAFLRMFKQLNHCTPTEFRNLYDADES